MRARAVLNACMVALFGALCSVSAAASSDTRRQLLQLEDIARSEPERVRGQLEALLEQMPQQDPLRVEGFLVLGKVAVDLNEREVAERHAEELDGLAISLGNGQERRDARAAASCLRVASRRGRVPAGQLDPQVDEALRDLGSAGTTGVQLACLRISGDLKEGRGLFEQAIAAYLRAIELADREQRTWQGTSLRVLHADALRQAGQWDAAEAANEDARVRALKAEDWRGLGEVLQVKALLATDRGRPDEQLVALQEAVSNAHRSGSMRDEALSFGNMADVYLQRKEYSHALELARMALPLAKRARDMEAQQLAEINLGLALIGLRRRDEGLPLVKEAIRQMRAAEQITMSASLLGQLAEALESAGFQQEAYETHRERRKLIDEVYRQTRQHAILELQEKHEAERRQRERTLLAEEGQLHEEALRKETLVFRMWLMLVALAALLTVLGLLWYRRVRLLQRELKVSNESLRQQSEHDPLTGLANRRQGQQRMQTEAKPVGTVYLMDLDHFKQINDRLGHAAGDLVLQEVAQRLRAVLREQDEVYRWGGEEFLIIVRSHSADQSDQLAQRLLQALAHVPVRVDQRFIAVTASVGYADFPLAPGPVEMGWDLALDLVDAAMYLAKTQGRNRACGVRHFPALSDAEVQAWLHDFEASWRRGHFSLVERQGPTPTGEQP